MKKKKQQAKSAEASIRLPIADVDFVSIATDPEMRQLKVKWLRPVSEEEFNKGIELIADFSLKMRRNLKASLKLGNPPQQREL